MFLLMLPVKTCNFILLVVLTSTICIAANAQLQQHQQNNYYIEHFGEEEGLPQNSINAILPDAADFLWLATESGICRFDGNHIIPVSFKGNISFTRVKNFYLRGKDSIIAYSMTSGTAGIIVNNKFAGVEENKDRLYFLNLHYSLPAPPYLTGDSAAYIYQQWQLEKGAYYGTKYNKDTFLVSLKDGIGIYDSRGMAGKIRIDSLIRRRLLYIDHMALYADRENYINIYSIKGLQRRQQLGIPVKHKLEIYNNDFGSNFFCVADSTLYSVDITASGDFTVHQILDNLKDPGGITTIYAKDSNTIVVGTLQNGLYVYKKQFFKTSESLPEGELDAFYVQQLLSDDKTILAGGNKLFINDHYAGKTRDIYTTQILAALKDSKGNYWYPYFDKLLRAKEIGVSPDTMRPNKGRPTRLFEDRQGRVWVSSTEEVGYFENDKYTVVKISNFKNGMTSYMEQDPTGRYFFATPTGLFILNNINEHEVKEVAELHSYDIKFVLPDSNGITWVCTYGQGLFLLTKDGITAFPQNGGKLAYVHCIIEDAKGYFWMPTNKGLYVTSRQSLLEYINNKNKVPFYYEFSKKNGWRTNEFNSGSQPAYLRLPDGDISLSSMQGLVRFNPSAINFNFSSSPILIDDIYADTAEILQQDNLEIASNINNINISVSSAFWGEPVNHLLEYQLVQDGKTLGDGAWIKADVTGKINLYAPSNGKYQLLFRKRTGLGADDYIYKTINFHVLPKWYQTKIFFATAAFALLLLMTMIIYWRRNYYRKANRILQQKVNAATTELQQMNNVLEKKVEERTMDIREAENRFRTLVEGSLVGVYIVQGGKYIYVNPRFEEILGYDKGELSGTESIVIIKKEYRDLVYEKARRRISGEVDSEHYEVTGVKKDGTEMQLEFFGSITIYKGKPTIIGTMVDVTEKKRMEQEILNQKIQEQKMVTRAVLIGEEKERNKIGQELHDNINQILVGTKLYLGMARKNKIGGENIINESIDLLDNAIEEIRTLSREKVTPTKKVNLEEILRNLTGRFQQTTTIRTNFVYKGSGPLIEDDLKLNIYRLIQEQLNNILKHAEAKNINVSVNADTKNIFVKVTDDGKGFDVHDLKRGIGISNMINRVESFNGTIDIQSSPGNGCRIDITMPF